jgi:hypothetical protein
MVAISSGPNPVGSMNRALAPLLLDLGGAPKPAFYAMLDAPRQGSGA